MTPFEQKVDDLKKEILTEVKTNGIYRRATCDAYGWDKDLHLAHKILQRRGIEGIFLECKVNFEVTDWTATID